MTTRLNEKEKSIPRKAAVSPKRAAAEPKSASKPRRLTKQPTPKKRSFLKRLVKKDDTKTEKKAGRSILKRARRIIKKDKDS